MASRVDKHSLSALLDKWKKVWKVKSLDPSLSLVLKKWWRLQDTGKQRLLWIVSNSFVLPSNSPTSHNCPVFVILKYLLPVWLLVYFVPWFNHLKVVEMMVSIRNIWINLTKVRIQFNPCDIILFRLTGLSPFAGEDKQETCYNVSLAALDFPEEYFKNISHTAQDFIKRLLQRDVEYVSYQYLLNNNSLRFYWLCQSFFLLI